MGTTPHDGLATNANIITAINQLAANQTAIMLQMAALLFAQDKLNTLTSQYVLRNTSQLPPIQQVAIPMKQ
jgi:hypothetical protein